MEVYHELVSVASLTAGPWILGRPRKFLWKSARFSLFYCPIFVEREVGRHSRGPGLFNAGKWGLWRGGFWFLSRDRDLRAQQMGSEFALNLFFSCIRWPTLPVIRRYGHWAAKLPGGDFAGPNFDHRTGQEGGEFIFAYGRHCA